MIKLKKLYFVLAIAFLLEYIDLFKDKKTNF